MTSKQKEQFNKDLIKELKAYGFKATPFSVERAQLDLEKGGLKIQVLTWAAAYNCLNIEGIEEPISTEGNLTFAQIKQQVELFTELTLEKPKKYDWDSCMESFGRVFYVDGSSSARVSERPTINLLRYNSLPTEKACNQLNAFTRLMIVVHVLNEDFESDGSIYCPNLDEIGAVCYHSNCLKTSPLALHSKAACDAFVSETSNIDLLEKLQGLQS